MDSEALCPAHRQAFAESIVNRKQRTAQDRTPGGQRPAAGAAASERPDPRLVALVRLLARHAARQDHEQELREAPDRANPDGPSPEE